MKKIFGALTVLLISARLFAQTNLPVKLALVAESDDAAPVVDVLTAQLSGNNKVQLLERDEIEKVYREQGLSAANRNDLKLGRILGADGLLLLNVSPSPGPAIPGIPSKPAEILTMRLIAVKPGVILASGSSSWPPKDITEWAQSARSYLDSFLPKLSVSAKDAIPISIVNLRSAVQSADVSKTERQLKLLVIQRLSREPQFFVLERQKMQLLSEEKNLNSDESAFWNGKYLLEGIIDQNGYSKDSIAINARLTLPGGASPLLFEVSGSRTNLIEVVNSLVAKVAESLNVSSRLKGWNAPDEAAQFFEEGKWALKWGDYEEAQAASESAWALGKHDLDCALVRVRAYASEIPEITGNGEEHFRSMADYASGKADSHYVPISASPNSENLDRAQYALEAYYEFSRTSADGQPRILTRGAGWNDWHNSDWYQLGIDTLHAASQVLQHYWYHPRSQAPVADKLADLRGLTRSVAALISQSPTIHDGYFVGDRIVTRDELSHTMEENPSIFRCEVNWGCFWQETPEDAVAFYRELMGSPVFCYVHTDFWNRKPIQPRLIAWNAEDQKNIPAIWASFTSELDNSTNVLWRMEAKALEVADASNDMKMAMAFTNFFNGILENRDAFVANNVEVMYLNWGADSLVESRTGNGIESDTKESLQRLFYSDYRKKFEDMDQDYWQKTIPALQTSSAFEKQKQYLADFTPYDFQTFENIFSFSNKNYTKAQAAELLPLVLAYESNMVATASPQKIFFAKANTQWIGMTLEKSVREILNPPAPSPVSSATVPAPVRASPPAVASVSSPPTVVPTNILSVVNFIKIPPEQIQTNDISGNQIFAQRWSDGKLLFGVAYNKEIDSFDEQSNWLSTREASLSAIAIFDPASLSWDFVKCPETANSSAVVYSMQGGNDRIILFQDSLFSSMDGGLKKFDFQRKQWSKIEIPEQDSCDLFSMAGHLYAINQNVIFELANDGSTHILASTRRRPAVTALDSLESFGDCQFNPPQLFAGPGQSLCASIGQKIYRWDESDWHEVLTMNSSQPPEIFDDGLIFRNIPSGGSDDSSELWFWDKHESQPELCLADRPLPHPGIITSPYRVRNTQVLHPLWNSLPQDSLTRSSAACYNSNLYFFVEHVNVANDSYHGNVTEKDGYHAKLVCLSHDCADPLVVPLRFDTRLGQLPLKILGQKVEPWLMFNSFALDTTMRFSNGRLYLCERCCPGVWSIPIAELEPAITAQKNR